MAEFFRLVSNGKQTYAELDGKVIGANLESIVFQCDATRKEKVTRIIVRGDIGADLKKERDDFDRIEELMRAARNKEEQNTSITVEVIEPFQQPLSIAMSS